MSPPVIEGGASEDEVGVFLEIDAGDDISRGYGM